MNKYIRAMYCIPTGFVKMLWTKLFHINNFKCNYICSISPLSEITIEKNARLTLGKNFKMRDGAKIRVRNGAECYIGNNSSINSNNIITCRKKIIIGDYVWLSPNVQIYDHDHDYKTLNGIKDNKYITDSIIIGNNVWIGANTIILKGTTIGDNSIIGAGCILKGNYPDKSVIVQKRINENLNNAK